MAGELRVLELNLLGAVQCVVAGRQVGVRGTKQRAVLALLALSAPHPVSQERLVAALWGDDPPPGARNALEAHVSRVRRMLREAGAPASILQTSPSGYKLVATSDVARFEQLCNAAAAANSEQESLRLLRGALSLWRGAPLVDLGDEPFAPATAARLEDLYLTAYEESLRYRLSLGEDQRLVPELEALTASHPLRERLRELLMIALYRAGRQSDALGVYQQIRTLLDTELGLDPSPSLRDLERAILNHDPAIQARRARTLDAPDAPGPDAPSHAPSSSRRRVWAGIAAAAAVVLSSGVIVLAVGFSPSPPRHPSPSGPRRPTKLTSHLLASVPVDLPDCCAFGDSAVWAVGHHDGRVYKIDPTTGQVVARYDIAGFQATEPLYAAGSLWIPAAAGDLVRFDPVRRRVVARFHIHTGGVAWGYNAFFATTRDHMLVRINYQTNKIVWQRRLAPGYDDFDDGIAIGFGSLWITNTDSAALLRIDPVSGKVIARLTGFGDTESWMPVSTGDASVWVYRITGSHSILYRVSPVTTSIVRRITVGYPNTAWPNGGITDAGGYVWTCEAGNTISQVDPRTNQVVGWYDLPESCQNVSLGFGSIWVPLYDQSRIYRVNPSGG